ncbi:hypothetical protein D9613_008035 [Agrocybe pediades]|uniref:Uncharacterized protein n=1 Tax=Agrocybe pediades TaxID=84607 RepID=A0A8H4QMU6_9AGAR|nr:hypothetical protein D9613_008035 [Agrocybe pediades]
MFDTLLDPNWGHCSQRGGRALTLWISYIFDYKLRQNPLLLPNGDLAPEVAKLKSSLKLENQQPFELWVRKKFTYKTAFDIRRDVLRKMGRLDLANRQYRRMWREIEHTFIWSDFQKSLERIKASEEAAKAAKEKKGARDLSSPAPSQR